MNVRAAVCCGVGVAALPAIAEAGMPSMELTDFARLRLETASFFLVGLLVSAAVVRWCWNLLARDFPRLPPLRYGGALVLFMFVAGTAMVGIAHQAAWLAQR